MCGLKLIARFVSIAVTLVTPFVGVWIETFVASKHGHALAVTPFVGVWIETTSKAEGEEFDMSHPSWVCGLKPIQYN